MSSAVSSKDEMQLRVQTPEFCVKVKPEETLNEFSVGLLKERALHVFLRANTEG